MRISSAGSTRQRVTADIKRRRGIGVVPAAAALRSHVTYGERLRTIGNKAVVS